MKKKLFSALLCLCMLLTLLPGAALAANAASVWVGGVELTAAAPYTADGLAASADPGEGSRGAGYALFDSGTATLVLRDFTYSGAGHNGAAVYADGDLTVVLEGASSVTQSGNSAGNSYGFYCNRTTTIIGTGSLKASGGAGNRSYGVYSGDYLSGDSCDLVICGSATVTAIGGVATDGSRGIYIGGAFTVSGGATVIAIAGDAGRSSNGIYSYSLGRAGYDIIICDSATVTATGGSATAEDSCGIRNNYNIVVSGSATVTATGGSAANQGSYGIYSFAGYIAISDNATVNATGGSAANQDSYGVFAYNGSVTISDNAAVTATGGSAANQDSFGIYAYDDGITISDSAAVTAVGGAAGNQSCGINSGVFAVTVSGGSVVAVGGDSDSSYGVYSKAADTVYTGGLLVAKGETASLNKAAAGSAASTVIAGENTTDSKYVVFGDAAIYHVITGDVTSETAAVPGHMMWNGSDVALINTIILGGDAASGDAAALTLPQNGKVILSGFNVALGGAAPSGSYGVSGNGLTIDGTGTLVAVGGTGQGESSGIASYSGPGVPNKVTLYGSTVTAIGGAGGNAAVSSAIIGDPVHFNGSTVTAIGNTRAMSLVPELTYADVAFPAGVTLTDTNIQDYRLVSVVSTASIVSYDPNGGSGAMSPYVLGPDTTVVTLPDCVFTAPTGKQFAKWAVGSVNGKQVSAGGAYAFSADTTVYALWADLPVRGESTSSLVTEIQSGGSITATNLDRLISDGKTLTVLGADGARLVFDTASLQGIEKQTSGDVTVQIEDVTTNYQDTLKGKRVFSLTVTSDGKTVTDFGGSVTVSLPYTLGEGEKAEDVTVWYLAPDGTLTEIPCTYDAAAGLATFTVSHFSEYVVGVADWVNPFSDVAEGDDCYDAVKWATQSQVTEGTGAATFSPDASCTRAQAVTLLWRAMGSPEPSATVNPFTDVEAGSYYYKAVLWAAEKGVTQGVSPTAFSPNEACSLAQIVTFQYRAAGSPAAGTENPFTDVSADAYYVSAVLWAVKEKIADGTTATTFGPEDDCTRGQIVTFLYRQFAK